MLIYMKRVLFLSVFILFTCQTAFAAEKGYTIITSDRMKNSTRNLEGAIQRVLGEAEPKELDYNSSEAKAWIEKLDIRMIPYVIFGRDIIENEKFIELAGQKMIARKNGEFVIPDAMLVPVGAMLFKREYKPGQLDIFVMSQCPYGNTALAQMANYIEKNPKAINVKCHYITTFREFGIDSLHGPEEIKENINQLLIQEKYPDKFWEYLEKRQPGRNFEDICKELGIDSDALKGLKDEGVRLLENDSNLCRELGISASPTFLWENQILIQNIDLLRQFLPEPTSSATSSDRRSDEVLPSYTAQNIIVFHSPACKHCRWLLDEYIPKLEKELGERIKFEYYDTTVQENFEKKLRMEEEFGVIGSAIPEVFVAGKALVGRPEIENKLKKIINKALGIEDASNRRPGLNLAYDSPRNDILLTTFQSFTPIAIVGAGFLDGINPCAFSTIVFFLSFLALAGYNRRRLILVAAVFTLAVFLTYLGLGIGAFAGLKQLRAVTVFSKYFDISVGTITIILGGLSLYDYIRFRKTGQAKDMILKLPGAIKNSIHQSIGGLRDTDKAGLLKVLLIAFGAGAIVSFLESVCTGQIYLPTITFILKMKVMWWKAFSLLMLYNAMFIAPLVIVAAAAFYGVASTWWAKLSQRHIGTVKLVTAALFFSIGVFILLWR